MSSSQRFSTGFVSQDRVFLLHKKYPTPPRRVLSPSNELERTESTYGTKSYSDALTRAFNHVKRQVFFNPDMQYFITFTYVGVSHTVDDVLADIKSFVRKTKKESQIEPKYAYVLEYQKRGSIHVHMIANNCFRTNWNQNGYKELTDWEHGFTSIHHVSDLDENFRPYLYLFKYMKKAQRIGKTFVHMSRNLTNYNKLGYDDIQLIQQRMEVIQKEVSSVELENIKLEFVKVYGKLNDN